MVVTKRQDAPDWHDVPAQSLARWNEVFGASSESDDLGLPCPACGATALHRWYFVGQPEVHEIEGRRYVARGSGWEWCGSCRAYQHFTGLVPDWWSSAVKVELDLLMHNPGTLDAAFRRR